jgi:hypothetical protein
MSALSSAPQDNQFRLKFRPDFRPNNQPKEIHMSDTLTFQTVLERVEQAEDEARSGGTPALDAEQLIADVSASLRADLEKELTAWPELIRSLIARGRYNELVDALNTADQGPAYTGEQLAEAVQRADRS